MKQYNFEEQLERKLKERAITPSLDAWERVAYNRQQQQKKRKKSLLWYLLPIAAILCIGLFITVTSNKDDIHTNKETIVSREIKQVKEPVNYETEIHSANNEIPTEVGAVVVIPSAPNPPYPAMAPLPDELINNAATNDLIKDLEIQKANEVAVAVTKLNEDGPVTEDMIDSLLLKAQREIALERLKTGHNAIDEAALLKEAETEVEKSFRDKVYHLFTHKTIKVAIKQ